MHQQCSLSTPIWRFTHKDPQRLSGFCNRCLKKSATFTGQKKITNQALYEKTGQSNIMTQIKQRRLRWFGHTVRRDPNNISKVKLKRAPSDGKRQRGRPKKSFKKTSKHWVQKHWKDLGCYGDNRWSLKVPGISLLRHRVGRG